MREKIYFLSLAISFSFFNPSVFANTMNKEEFGKYVFTFLNDTYKDKMFERSNDSLLILTENTQLGLLNLYSSYNEDESSKKEINNLLKQHFDKMFTQIELGIKSENISWSDAKRFLRPMIGTDKLTFLAL